MTDRRGLGPVVLVFAKEAVAGRVKTRLCPPLSPETAATFHRACVEDLWQRLGDLSGIQRVLCCDSPEAVPWFWELLGRDTEILVQVEGGLGRRLSEAFRCTFARGRGPVVAIGADSPNLPMEMIGEAVELLAVSSCDVVIGPAEDGGYVLIGLNRSQPELFEGIHWSTDEVFRATQERCTATTLRVHELETWYDVDDATSLARLRARALACPDELPRLYRFFSGR